MCLCPLHGFHLGSLQKTPSNFILLTLGQSTSFPKNVIAWKPRCSCSWVCRRGFHTPPAFAAGEEDMGPEEAVVQHLFLLN